MTEKFKNDELFSLLQQSFPKYIQPSDIDNCIAQIIAPSTDIESNTAGVGITESMGGLIVILNQDDNGHQQLWLRNFLPYSHYEIENSDELLAIIDGVIHDEVFWFIEYKLDEHDEIDSWHGSTLIDKEDLMDNQFEQEAGIAYQVTSWSGKFDRLIIR